MNILIVNAKIVNEGKVIESDVLIRNERIEKIGPNLSSKDATIIDAEGKRRPKDTFLQQDWIPQVRAAIEIKRGNPAAAVEALKPAALLEPNDIAPTFYRGLAYLSMKSGKEAAAEFRKIVDRKTINPLSPLHAISQLQLGRSRCRPSNEPHGGPREVQLASGSKGFGSERRPRSFGRGGRSPLRL